MVILRTGPAMAGTKGSATGMASFDPTHGPADNQRAEPRKRTLKGAKLVFNGGVIDCTVLDICAKGALVLLLAPMQLPEQVALHLSGGVVYHARRRWGRGQDVGFEFEEGPPLSAVAATRALPLYEALRDISPDQVLAGLQAERWFDDPVLSDLAQSWVLLMPPWSRPCANGSCRNRLPQTPHKADCSARGTWSALQSGRPGSRR